MKILVVTNMYPTPETPASGTFVRDQVEALRKEGIDVDVLFIDGMKNKLNYLWGIFRLWSRLINGHYDLIHAHYVFSGLVARMQLLCPVVLTHHGYEVFMTWERFPSRMITPLVNKVILVSQEQKAKLKREDAEIIPCGIDIDLFRPMPREEAQKRLNFSAENKKYVLALWAGALSRPEKRYDIVEQAIALLRERDPSVELVPVTGQPHEKIPLYMNACDALVLVSDGEGSPVVIKEAMACNLPIVSVPAGDVPDIIGDTGGCYICTQEPADVAEKLSLALNYPGRTSGRQRVMDMDHSAVARRIIRLYRDILKDKKGKSEIRRYREDRIR